MTVSSPIWMVGPMPDPEIKHQKTSKCLSKTGTDKIKAGRKQRMQELDSPGPCPPIDTIRKRGKKERWCDLAAQTERWPWQWVELTCDQTLAGISRGDGVNAIGGGWNLVSPVFDGNGVTARHVWYVGHRVRPVPVVPDVGLLWLPLWILELAHRHNSGGHASNRTRSANQT